MFSAEQKTALAAPLSTSAIRKREQSGRKLSYVEGWHVIAEANRIFGFDGWSRETVELKCVSEKDRIIGKTDTKPGYPGFGVSYIARVRVMVGPIIREGCGTGHGIDRDLGQAHESALKEAETDAMKRALMTFGNPFGLALYDKEQTNVASEGGMAKAASAPAKPAPVEASKISNGALDMMTMIDGCDTVRALDNYAETTLKTAITKLGATDADLVRTRFGQRKAALKSAQHLAA